MILWLYYVRRGAVENVTLSRNRRTVGFLFEGSAFVVSGGLRQFAGASSNLCKLYVHKYIYIYIYITFLLFYSKFVMN
jgi:hypothetical protein